MGRLRDLIVILAVAAALPGAALVHGQVEKYAVKRQEGEAVKKEEAKPVAKDEAKPAAAVKARAVRRAVVGRAVPAAAVIDAQAAQYLQQFRPLARGEYYFIKNTCGITAEQKKPLAEAAEQAARGASRAFVEAQQNMMRGGMVQGVSYPDPQKLVEDEMSKAAGLLTAGQQETYRKERALRAASRKKMFIDNFVAKLDADLVLTTAQREQLVASLETHWKDAWGQSMDMLTNLDSFFPDIPDAAVVPLLSDKQKTAWRQVPRQRGVMFGFGGGMLGQWDPDPLDDPELAAARKAAEEKDKEKEKK